MIFLMKFFFYDKNKILRGKSYLMKNHIFNINNQTLKYNQINGHFDFLINPIFNIDNQIKNQKKINFKKKINTISLGISNKCQLKCEYCYEKNNTHIEVDLELNQIDNIIKYINENEIFDENILINFTGKEPLLETEKIEYFINKLNKSDKKVKYIISTNGISLIDDNIKKIDRYIFQYYISIDGYKEIHDLKRKFKNNSGSFNIIIKNILNYKKKFNQKKINLRMVVDPYEKIDLIKVDNLFTSLIDNVYILQTLKEKNIINSNENDISFYKNELHRYYDYYLDKILIGSKIKSSKIINNIKRLLTPFYFSYPCDGGITSMHFLNDLYIYPCAELSNDSKYLIKNNKFNYKLLKDKKTKCKQCWIKYLCGGKCIKTLDVLCEIKKFETELTIYFILTILKQNKNKIENINWKKLIFDLIK